jgi:hypothetical protein
MAGRNAHDAITEISSDNLFSPHNDKCYYTIQSKQNSLRVQEYTLRTAILQNAGTKDLSSAIDNFRSICTSSPRRSVPFIAISRNAP